MLPSQAAGTVVVVVGAQTCAATTTPLSLWSRAWQQHVQQHKRGSWRLQQE